MRRSRNRFIPRGLIGLVCLGAAIAPVFGRDVKLVLSPQKTSAEIEKVSLLPPEGSLTDGDALPLYEKAVKALPDKAGNEQIQKWLQMPIDQLPLEQVDQVLKQHLDSFKSAAKAAKCRQCNWPEFTPQMVVPNLQEYRRLAFAIRLWARREIADDGHEGALLALQTGFAMARRLGQAPTIIQALVGTAVGHSLCREVEEFVQREGAPNLYTALAGLPQPFVQMEKAIETEKEIAAGAPAGMEGKTDAAHDRCRVIVKRFDSNLAALQCVEAIRSYAVSHGGQLPETLAEITEVAVPKDPMNDQPFRYTRTGSTATLESFLPPGGDEKDRIRYEISVRK